MRQAAKTKLSEWESAIRAVDSALQTALATFGGVASVAANKVRPQSVLRHSSHDGCTLACPVACLPACLPAYLPTNLATRPPACLACPPTNPLVCLAAFLSIYLTVSLTDRPANRSINRPTDRPTDQARAHVKKLQERADAELADVRKANKKAGKELSEAILAEHGAAKRRVELYSRDVELLGEGGDASEAELTEALANFRKAEGQLAESVVKLEDGEAQIAMATAEVELREAQSLVLQATMASTEARIAGKSAVQADELKVGLSFPLVHCRPAKHRTAESQDIALPGHTTPALHMVRHSSSSRHLSTGTSCTRACRCERYAAKSLVGGEGSSNSETAEGGRGARAVAAAAGRCSGSGKRSGAE